MKVTVVLELNNREALELERSYGWVFSDAAATAAHRLHAPKESIDVKALHNACLCH